MEATFYSLSGKQEFRGELVRFQLCSVKGSPVGFDVGLPTHVLQKTVLWDREVTNFMRDC